MQQQSSDKRCNQPAQSQRGRNEMWHLLRLRVSAQNKSCRCSYKNGDSIRTGGICSKHGKMSATHLHIVPAMFGARFRRLSAWQLGQSTSIHSTRQQTRPSALTNILRASAVSTTTSGHYANPIREGGRPGCGFVWHLTESVCPAIVRTMLDLSSPYKPPGGSHTADNMPPLG
ncbi:hypothetical protein MHYP_G00147390 [Metynnis hypsauchen]